MNILDLLAEIKNAILRTEDEREVVAYKRLAAAENYAAEDVLSESTTVGTAFNFVNVVAKQGGSGEIVGAQVFMQTTALTPRLSLYLYKYTPTSALNDNVANTAVSLADLPISAGRIDFTALEDLGGVSESIITTSTYGNLPVRFQCADDSRKLFGILVTRDAITGETVNDRCEIRLRVRSL